MQRTCRVAFLFAVLLLCGAAARAQTDFALRDGDRVVFYGDSITDQRLYTTFVETYAVTRFPRRNLRFVHSGWGGDRVTGGGGGPIDLRLERDVIAYKPTVMTIMLGMNDASYKPFDESVFQTYATGYRHILDRVTKALPGIRLTLIQPSPFDDVTRAPTFEGGYNAVLVRYSDFVRDLAAKQGAAVADLNTPVVAALKRANAFDAETAQKILPDRVHPGPGGHLLMAAALLQAWNAPAIVTAVTIDGAGSRVTQARNTKVTGLSGGTNGALSWTQADDALPLPLDRNDPVIALALRSSDVIESLNRQPLQVTGLTGARYTLKIDGEEVGAFTKEQLAEGINLAVLPTPMQKQAAAVHTLTLGHNQIHFIRWRQIQVPLQEEKLRGTKPALDALDALEEEMVRKQRETAQPKPRRYELSPNG